MLYCSVDPTLYYPEPQPPQWDLGYMGTYSADRQPTRRASCCSSRRGGWPPGRFVVAGPQYPADIAWPANVERPTHLPPAEHRAFYNRQRFTLNVTRADMIAAGWSPSVRLFEAAACGTPIISDRWAGIETLLEPGREIVLVGHARTTCCRLLRSTGERRALRASASARARASWPSTPRRTAPSELEGYALELLRPRPQPGGTRAAALSTEAAP